MKPEEQDSKLDNYSRRTQKNIQHTYRCPNSVYRKLEITKTIVGRKIVEMAVDIFFECNKLFREV